MRFDRLKRVMLVIVLMALVVPSSRVVFPTIRAVVCALDGAPYRMMLRPGSDSCLVQFSRPDLNLVSPVFVTDLPVKAPRVVELLSDDLRIPGCVVQFYDSAPLPGIFRLRIGRTRYEVMESRIEVDGSIYRWSKGTPLVN